MSASFQRLLIAALTLLALVALPVAASANMAAPRPPGQAIGEPSGELAALHVEREILTVDLRPLELERPVDISATYLIRNDGAARSVELVFVAAALQNGSRPAVTLDGAPVAYQSESTSGNAKPRGVTWAPPSTTPDFAGGDLNYASRWLGAIYFTLEIGPGQHNVEVRYQAEATKLQTDPVVHWQVGYVLSPAREWASFGALEVLVHVPANFRLAAEPSLQLSGTEARGTFNGVPADNLTLTAQFVPTPVPPNYSLPVALGIAFAIGILLALLGGRILAGRGGRARSFLPVSLVYGLLASIGVVFAVIATGFLSRPHIPVPQQPQRYISFDGSALVDLVLLLVLVFPATLIGLVLVMQLVVLLMTRSRTRTTQPM